MQPDQYANGTHRKRTGHQRLHIPSPRKIVSHDVSSPDNPARGDQAARAFLTADICIANRLTCPYFGSMTGWRRQVIFAIRHSVKSIDTHMSFRGWIDTDIRGFSSLAQVTEVSATAGIRLCIDRSRRGETG
jgi:hypothetical protein